MPEPGEAWERLSDRTAQVLLCDLQEQIVARSKTISPKALRKSAGVLLQIAKLFSLPTTLSVVPEQQKAPKFIPELRRADGYATAKLRATASPFLETSTTETLATASRNVLIVAGFATEVVVLQAVLDARKAGYDVLVPVDACGGMSARTEEAAFRQIEAAGAITTSVVSIATKLAPDFDTECGRQMFGIVQKLRLS